LGVKRAGEFWIPDAEIHREAAIARGEGPPPELFGHIKSFRVAVDAGANVGTWTRALLSRFDVVYAFEPAPDTFECLERNCPEALCIQAGLSDQAGTASIKPDETYPDGTGSRYLADGKDILLTALDSFHLSLDFLKVDVEGMECKVLKGAMQTLMRCKPVLCVEDKKRLADRAGLPQPWELLESIGYRQVGKVGPDRIYA
jgi:FkbM family methyltransferase